MGRPGHLSVQEEAEVSQLIKILRLDGVAVDYDVMCRIGREIAAERRGVPVHEVPGHGGGFDRIFSFKLV